MSSKINHKKIIMFLLLSLLLSAQVAFAGESLPWNTNLEKIQQSITGPAAVTFAIVGIAAFAIGIMMGAHGSLIKQGGMIIVGVTVLLQATKIVTLFGSGSGALIL